MKVLFVLAVIGMACIVSADETIVSVKDKPDLEFDAGGDLRLRYESFNNIPLRRINGVPGTIDKLNYLRVRTRVWGEAKYKNLKLHTRLANEFREYLDPDGIDNYEAPDELFLDALYLDAVGLFDGWLDLRVGRQELKYGAGRVIFDGTPSDGTRSGFSDAVKASVVFDEKRKNVLDLLAIYNKAENELSVGELEGMSDRQIRSIVPGSQGLDEWGGGAYFRSAELEEMPFDLYWIYKRESKADLKGTTLDGRRFHTWGALLMPQYTETLSGEFEGAYQSGERDGGESVHGYMAFAAIKYAPSVEWKAKPYLKPGFYYLSGDTDHSQGHSDSGWNPVWARYPQMSTLGCFTSKDGIGYWTNLLYPHIETGFNVSKKHKLRMAVGPMYVDRKNGLGGGEGNLYGWLGTFRYDFPILKNILKREDKRGNLFGRLQAEVLDPGDYYVSDQVALFLRLELLATF